MESLALDDTTERLAVRGIEFDKMLSVVMLTQRSFGWGRYESKSLRFSFPELETLMFPNDPSASNPRMIC